jgi:hypothetical protein
MAKTTPLTLADLNMSLGKADMKMNPAVAAQLKEAAGGVATSDVQLTKGLGPNLEKNLNNLASAIKENTASTKANTEALTKGKTSGKNAESHDLSENQLEDRRVQDNQTSLLGVIAKNTVPPKGTKAGKVDDSGWGMLGGWGLALAAAIGTFVGIVTAQIKVMIDTFKFIGRAVKGLYNIVDKAFGGTITKALQVIPNFFKDMVAKFEVNLTYARNLVVDFFRNKFSRVFIAIENGLNTVREFFSKMFKAGGDGIGKIGEVFGKVAQGIRNFFAPIGEAWTTIKNFATPVQSAISKVTGFFRGIADFFTGVVSKVSVFSKVVGAFAKIVGKLAYPITIIMGLFDGITQAIEGYNKGGIMGGIEGFVTGVLNSLIGGLLDLLKDGVSWILGALGFDQAEKFLDSFSFSDMIKDFIHALFHPIDTIKRIIKNIGNLLAKIEIPGIDFSIFGKNFKFGPWKPFDSLGGNDTSTPNDTKPAGDQKAPEVVPPPTTDQPPQVVPPPAEANRVYNASAENDAARTGAGKSSPITSVVNAPTTVNKQTQNNMIKTPVRNQLNTINSYYRSRYPV